MEKKLNNQNKTKKCQDNKNKIICSPFLLGLLFLLFVIINVALLFSALNGYREGPYPIVTSVDKEGAIKKFKDYNEVERFLGEGLVNISKNSLLRENIMTAGDAWGAGNLSLPPTSLPLVEDVTSEKAEQGLDYSTTNIQVEGVDEGDIIKNDGKYVYVISGKKVVIIEAYPVNNASILSEIKFDSIPIGIYVKENKLAIYGNDNSAYRKSDYGKGDYDELFKKRKSVNHSFLKIFDISDKKNPKEERSLSFEGNFINSRLIGDYIYFITKDNTYYYKNETPIPLIMENGKVLNTKDIDCEDCWNVYYFNIPYRSHNLTNISAINISDSKEKISNSTYLLDGNQNNMFVSQNNIYMTYNKYVSEEELVWKATKEMMLSKLDAKDREVIAEIEKTKDYILSQQEKIEKIMLIIVNFTESLNEDEQKELEKELEERVKKEYEDISKELEKTVIHKIAINEGKLQYRTAGEVPGAVLNQFSMDENNNYFRIATTKNRSWSNFVENNESYNNLYVLDDNMKIIGQVEKLAKSERIYSVRFMQNRAYMVTFRQTDPLFVIDLKDPTNPQVLGELKIPGFSNYLHPYNETTLIGLGKDSGSWDAKLKLSLFDVSDVANPKETDNYIFGEKRGNSLALTDHKAFLFSKNKNLLAIPASWEEKIFTNNTNEENGLIEEKKVITLPSVKYFYGATVFYVDKNGFKLKGKISHYNKDEKQNKQNQVKRSLYIENTLYTASDMYLKMNDLNSDDLKETNVLQLTNDSNILPPSTCGSEFCGSTDELMSE